MPGLRLAVAVTLLVSARSMGEGARRLPQVVPAATATPTTPAARATPGPAAGAGFDLNRPCTAISAAEVSSVVGFTVTAADEHWRCKFVDAKNGWLSVKLLEATSRISKEICEYAANKRTVVRGVGDSASYFGSTACVKVGDVMIVVDGSDVAERSAQLAKSGADNAFIRIGKVIAARIP